MLSLIFCILIFIKNLEYFRRKTFLKSCCCSVVKSCLTLRDPKDCSMPGSSVLHYLPEFTQIHIHWVSDAVQPSHPLLLDSPSAFNLSQNQGLFPMSRFFPSGGQSTGASASILVLPMNTQDWSPLGWTGWISLFSKGLSRVFSNTTVQKQLFFSAQPSLCSNSHIQTWPLEKPYLRLYRSLAAVSRHFLICCLGLS